MGSPDLQHSKSSSSSGSSSGSTAKTSPPSSPDNDPDGLQRPPRPTAHYSSTPPRRGNRHAVHTPPATHRLGVIDEDSPRVAPDIPTRHPDRPRKTVAFLPVDAKRLFSFSAYARPGEDVPPPDVYEKITGPRGEKFGDLRRNRPYHPPGRGGGWRRMVCLGCVAFVILVVLGIALGVGLGVGLTKRKGASSQPISTDPVPADNTTSSSNNQNYPLGTFAIPTYLTTTNTSCTSNPSTWRCYPYTTYSQSTTNSFSTLLWRITSPTNSTLDLQISNTNPAFSYPFTNVPLTLSDAGNLQQSAFTFSFTFRKQVIPDADITGGDNAATRCYYNNTLVSVRLYNNAQGGGGNVTRPPNGQSDTQNGSEGELWPYAIEFEERIAEPPECFRYVNGEEGAVVPVAEGVGECVCGYRNFGL